MSEETKDYSRGYAAGRRRLDMDLSREKERENLRSFRQAIFLAALPSFLNGAWQRGDKKISTVAERVQTTWDAVDDAIRLKRD